MQNKSFFIIEKIANHLKCPALPVALVVGGEPGGPAGPLVVDAVGALEVGQLHGQVQPHRVGGNVAVGQDNLNDSDRAGHLRYFFIFSLIKNDFFALFIKLITYFCTSPI